MKKFALLSIFALGLGMVSCDDFDYPNPPGQSNPQEPIFDTANLNMAATAGSGTIDLIAANNSDVLVPLAEVVSVDGLPEGYNLSFVGQMASTDAFADAVDFATVVDGTQIYGNPDVLDATYHEALGTIDPNAKTVNIRYKAYATNGTSTLRLGGSDVYFCPMTASIKPFAPDFVVEEAYYLIGTCSDGKIDASKAIKMSNSGKSPYDDPNFSVIVDITEDQAAAGYEWAVVPASTLAAGSGTVMAPTDVELAAEEKGYLMNYTSTGTWAVINASNTHMIQVNVKADKDGFYSYSSQLAIQNLYTPGPANNWTAAESQKLFTNNYTTYQGYVHVNGMFKFTSAPDWDHTNYGFASAGVLTTDGSAGNIEVSQDNEPLTDGLYWCTADIVALTYTTTAINTVGIIGDATEGGWDAETKMTHSDDFLTWTVTTTLKEGTFKFRFNDNWDINLGGSLLDLTPGADNIPAPTTGNVTITLDLSTIPYTATVK